MALSRTDERGLHAAYAILQRVVALALESDLRAGTMSDVDESVLAVHDAIQASLQRMFVMDMDSTASAQTTMPAEPGGLAIRSPARPGGHHLAKWSALAAALQPAKELCAELEFATIWGMVDAEMKHTADSLKHFGIDVTSGKPVLTLEAQKEVQDCAATAEIFAFDELKQRALPPDRSRLQGRGGKLIDMVRLARGWPKMSQWRQETILSQAGVGEGTLFGDISADEREGWLADHHFGHAVLTRMGAPVCAPGHRCSLTPQSGPRKGIQCQQPLDRHGRHLQPCRAGGIATRLHHSLRRRLATSLRESGLRAEEEIVLPELSQITDDGVKEGRMDIVVTRPGGVSRYLIDVATCDARAARSGSCRTSFNLAEQDKFNRYKGSAWPFAVEHRGRLGERALDLLEILAGEAALLGGGRPSTLVRKWRRQLQLVAAFELAEVMRAQLCGLADDKLASASTNAADSKSAKYKSSPSNACVVPSPQPPLHAHALSACTLHASAAST